MELAKTSPQLAIDAGRCYAIDSRAIGGPLDILPLGQSRADSVAVLTVCGALPAAAYACVVDCAKQLFADSAIAGVVLAVDSPGGEVSGAFAAARQLKRAAKAAGKPLIGFTSGTAASAAYALISACDSICATDSAVLGSIGVISIMNSMSRQANALGVDVQVITSGARKADGCPATPITDGAIAATQVIVNDMAEAFFDLVAEFRPQAADPQSLEAAVFVGQKALSVGLADTLVASIDDAIALALAPQSAAPNLPNSTNMADEKDKPAEDATRAALVTASESDDPEKARKAKAALAAYDTDEGEKDDEDKDKDKAASESSAKAVAALAAQVQALNSQLSAERAEKKAAAEAAAKATADADRAKLFASRPDLAPSLVETLKSLPVAQAKAIVDGIPVAGNPLVATTTVAPAAGAGQGSSQPGLSGPENVAMLDAAFGLNRVVIAPPTLESGIKQTFGRVSTVKAS